MKKLLIYYNFIIISLMVVVGFVSATNYLQLAVAAIFYPLFIYFASRVFPRKAHAVNLPKKPVVIVQPAGGNPPEKIDAATVKLKKEGVDIDRRMFLKLIGSAGVSLFMFSLFTKKAEAAFFGSAPGPGVVALKDSAGNKIDPAEKQPTDGYRISRLDDGIPAYYGFTNKNHAWFVMKELDDGSYLYRRGASGFATAWSERDGVGIVYGEYENVFGD
jgi:hypothetical protein